MEFWFHLTWHLSLLFDHQGARYGGSPEEGEKSLSRPTKTKSVLCRIAQAHATFIPYPNVMTSHSAGALLLEAHKTDHHCSLLRSTVMHTHTSISCFNICSSVASVMCVPLCCCKNVCAVTHLARLNTVDPYAVGAIVRAVHEWKLAVIPLHAYPSNWGTLQRQAAVTAPLRRGTHAFVHKDWSPAGRPCLCCNRLVFWWNESLPNESIFKATYCLFLQWK